MKAVLYNGKNKVSVNFSKGEDISIPLSFNPFSNVVIDSLNVCVSI